ncbi:RDD family protein [Jeotgalibacillus haloalkalitolerans]|uniref:RDD family protein n=1 Tax=Jeotgalibacillus haloalkalitolerans TaxID=3104292 RepID=A0ABU5KNQ7_9BACL|nr:RDD family protein [Jeotgalibacillus sp. HH7-29]MDZ5712723.1 RDD family protein [Jeotgalibacillus sp. HH7-29]
MNASFTIRLKAFLLDYIFIFFYLIALMLLSLFILPELQRFLNDASLFMRQFAGFMLVTFPVSLYFVISDSKIGLQSFGKRRLNIRVVDQNGDAVSVLRMTFRTFLKFLPWEISHFFVYQITAGNDSTVFLTLFGVLIYGLMLLYILTAVFTKEKQSVYDMIAKTKVIKV